MLKIEVVVTNRVGITQEVLAVLANNHLDLHAMQMVLEHIYLDIPDLTLQQFPRIQTNLMQIEGIDAVYPIELLPDEQRRLHLDALLSTLPDPVFAIDINGIILSANSSATEPLSVSEQSLIGRSINDVLSGNMDILDNEPCEVMLAGQPYLLEEIPIDNEASTTAGRMLVLQAPTRLGHQISKVQMGSLSGFEAITGQSRQLMQIKERAHRFATIRAPLLIQGETGTGKELFARAVHQAGPWHHEPFLVLNCAALPENLVESELFGYAAGAFSGAARGGKPGLLELANGGTAFLDEVGEMSTYVQAKLLRFIQDGSFRRVGDKIERKVDVRIICATHRDLEARVSEGLFREDLMYRLNVLNLTLPPLRDHREDIPLLARQFVQRAAEQIGCHTPSISTHGQKLLSNYRWPGNVRQLENLLFRAVALSQGPKLDVEQLELAGLHQQENDYTDEPESWQSAQAEFEQQLLGRLYERYPSTRKLAKRLGVSHTTIADKLRAYNIGKKS